MTQINKEILDELQGLKIAERESYLGSVGFFKDAKQSKYAIVFEKDIDAPCSVLHASPNWLAMAMHGDLLPPVEVYSMLEFNDNGNITNGHILHDQTIPAMSEEESIEYLAIKDLPLHVVAYQSGNRIKFKIVNRDTIPTDRTDRMAWRLN